MKAAEGRGMQNERLSLAHSPVPAPSQLNTYIRGGIRFSTRASSLSAAYKVLLLTLENILPPSVNVSRIFHEVTLFFFLADFLAWPTVRKVS